jgi:nucleotide-binding universal stress UspA family protein
VAYQTIAINALTFQNILLATDFSDCSDAALPFARALADRCGSILHLVHVAESPAVAGEPSVIFIDSERQKRQACERLDRLAKSDALKGVQCTQTVTQGAVAPTITKMAEDARLDLIVVGTHGRRGFSHLLLGSVAEQVFRNASCPVLTVGPKVSRRGLAEGKVGAILFATDFSPAALHAYEYALSLARMHQARLLLVHAVESHPVLLNYADDSSVAARQRLSELVPKDPELAAEVVIQVGPAADVILQRATESQADLIVMGVRRHLGYSSHLPWATAHAVVCRACCPVLTVPN